jgi:YHS domain-containing protein
VQPDGLAVADNKSGKKGMQIMQKLIMVLLGLVLVVGVAGAGLAADPPLTQTVCPVLGGHIDKNVYADYQGKRVYFCCPGCVDPFNQNPGQYLKKLETQGITPERSPGRK